MLISFGFWFTEIASDAVKRNCYDFDFLVATIVA